VELWTAATRLPTSAARLPQGGFVFLLSGPAFREPRELETSLLERLLSVAFAVVRFS